MPTVTTGGIVGSTGSDDNRLLRANGTGGRTVQASGITVDDDGDITSFGGQLGFPATQNASADANTLDDYEEGTWTPALAFGGASVSLTYTTRQGTYTKIGRKFTAQMYIALSNKGSSTGAATLGGLPFTAAATPSFVAVVPGYYNAMSGLSYGIGGYVTASSTTWTIRSDTATDSAGVTQANFTNTSEIILTFICEV